MSDVDRRTLAGRNDRQLLERIDTLEAEREDAQLEIKALRMALETSGERRVAAESERERLQEQARLREIDYWQVESERERLEGENARLRDALATIEQAIAFSQKVMSPNHELYPESFIVNIYNVARRGLAHPAKLPREPGEDRGET